MTIARKTTRKKSSKHTSSLPAGKPVKQNLVKQGAKFGVVGISNTVIDYTIFIVASTLLNVPVGQSYIVKFFSGSAAMINSFYWNRRWVFASRANVGKTGVKFLTATLVSVYAIQPFMVHTFTATTAGVAVGAFWYGVAQAIGIAKLLPHTVTEAWVVKTFAFGMGVVGSAIWNFTMYKLWAFRD
jgi:putative flippase GtrA